jgi:adenosylmethionine-8-amino-7-oxononanoate aminotransferase
MSDPALLAPPGLHLPVVSHGEGVWLVDEAGRRYLDGSSGAVVTSLGHGNAEISAALQQQAMTVAFAHRTQFRNRPAEDLAAALVDLAPPPLARAALLSSGSEANELAMKLAVRFWQEQGQPRKHGIISRWTSYHGSTLGALSATGHPARRRPFADLLHPFPRVSPPYCLRCPVGASPENCAEACLEDFEVAIQREGPERLAAFIAEPVVGAAAGVLVPPSGYHERVRELCDQYELLWIADEVMSGCGRTGRWLAVEHWDTVPDLVTLGKGLTGGYAPLSVVLCTSKVAAALGSDELGAAAAHTYTNTPLPAAVGLAALEVMKRQDLVGRASALGVVLHEALASLSQEIEMIGDVRGLGLLQGVELVADRQTLEPFDPKLRVTARIVEAARHRGLLVYPAPLGINGQAGDAIVVAPPLIISETDIGELVTRLREALLDVSLNLNEAGPPHGFPRGGGTTLEVGGKESSSVVSVRGSKSREEE